MFVADTPSESIRSSASVILHIPKFLQAASVLPSLSLRSNCLNHYLLNILSSKQGLAFVAMLTETGKQSIALESKLADSAPLNKSQPAQAACLGGGQPEQQAQLSTGSTASASLRTDFMQSLPGPPWFSQQVPSLAAARPSAGTFAGPGAPSAVMQR